MRSIAALSATAAVLMAAVLMGGVLMGGVAQAATTLATVKARYKELVKRYHPDANGGDNSAEDRLKGINLAYSVLKNVLQQ